MGKSSLLPLTGMLGVVAGLLTIERSGSGSLSSTGALPDLKSYLVTMKWVTLLVSIMLMSYFGRIMMEQSPIPALPPNKTRTQSYGDQMALEGHTSNIWKPLTTLYAFVIFVGSMASIATGCSMATVPAYYGVGMAVFYLWHLCAHWTKGEMNTIHMEHHKQQFAHNDFYGDRSGAIHKRFADLGGNPPTLRDLLDPHYTITFKWAHDGPLFSAMMVILVGGYLIARTPIIALAAVQAGYTIMAVLGSAIHISFHVRGFEMESYDWYRELRTLHYVHHLRRRNFAMVNMDMDRLAGTYQEVTSHESKGCLCI